MSLNGKIVIGFLSLILVFIVLELLRRRKLNEEYCIWWIFMAGAMILMVLHEGLLMGITHLIGALAPTSTLTLMSLAIILGMLIFFSMKISILTNQLKELTQAVALHGTEPVAYSHGEPTHRGENHE